MKEDSTALLERKRALCLRNRIEIRRSHLASALTRLRNYGRSSILGGLRYFIGCMMWSLSNSSLLQSSNLSVSLSFFIVTIAGCQSIPWFIRQGAHFGQEALNVLNELDASVPATLTRP